MTLHFVIRLKLQRYFSSVSRRVREQEEGKLVKGEGFFSLFWSACYLCLNVEREASGFCDAEGELTSAPHAATLGREFGHLMRVWPVITYSLSPLEQRAFPHYFSEGHAQHAAPHSGVHLSRRAAICSVLFCLHMGNTGVWEIQEEESSCLWKWQMSNSSG